jgi:hypothetical protein
MKTEAGSCSWSGRCQAAFEKLKRLLIEALLLRSLDEALPDEVVMNASDIGPSAVLLQERHPVASEARKLDSVKLNHTVIGKEMLNVIHALHV